MNSTTKNILIFGGLGVALILIYVLFLKPAPDQGALTSSTGTDATAVANPATDQASVIGQDFLTLLLNVKNLKLNNSIFSDPAFLSLHDSSITLVSDGTEGRPNPFAPLGSDISASAINATTTPTPAPSTTVTPAVPPTTTPVAPTTTNTSTPVKSTTTKP